MSLSGLGLLNFEDGWCDRARTHGIIITFGLKLTLSGTIIIVFAYNALILPEGGKNCMLEFALWPLWRLLKPRLKSLADKKFSVMGDQFKALLSSTLDDLIVAMQGNFFSTDTWKHLAKTTVSTRDGKKSVTFEAFPLDAINQSAKIRDALVPYLKQNVRLDVVRTKAGISNTDWDKLVEEYASEVLRLGLPFALKRMIRHRMTLYLSEYVIDIAEGESIRVKGIAGYQTLVILYDKPSSEKSAKKAIKTWAKRNSDTYQYQWGNYNGFKAP